MSPWSREMSGVPLDSIDRYIEEISDLPLLTADGEKELAREMRRREARWRTALLSSPCSAAVLAEIWQSYRCAGRKSSRLLSSSLSAVDEARESQASKTLSGLEASIARRQRAVKQKPRESIVRSDRRRTRQLEELGLEVRVLEEVSRRLECSLERFARSCGEPLRCARESFHRAAEAYDSYRETREEFVTSNVKLVIFIAKGHMGRGLPFEDLIQEGNLGLLRAVEKFDPDRGVRFSSYASFWIKQAVQRAIEMRSRMVRTPTSMGSRFRALSREDSRRVARGDDPMTLEERSESFGMPVSDFQSLTAAFQPAISLDHSPLEDGEPLIQLLAADDEELLDYLEHRDRCERVHVLLDRLNSRERMIVERRYGLRGDPPETLESIGCDLGLSRERIRQLERLALDRLREDDPVAP